MQTDTLDPEMTDVLSPGVVDGSMGCYDGIRWMHGFDARGNVLHT
jgi:hypothetical protein